MKSKRIWILWLLTLLIGSLLLGAVVQIEKGFGQEDIEFNGVLHFIQVIGWPYTLAGFIGLFAGLFSLPVILLILFVKKQNANKPRMIQKRNLVLTHLFGTILTVGTIMFLNYGDGGRVWLICAIYTGTAILLWANELRRPVQ